RCRRRARAAREAQDEDSAGARESASEARESELRRERAARDRRAGASAHCGFPEAGRRDRGTRTPCRITQACPLTEPLSADLPWTHPFLPWSLRPTPWSTSAARSSN